MGKLSKIFTVLFIMFFMAKITMAEDEMPIHGFLQLNYSARITEDDDYVLAEERFQLELANDLNDPVIASYFIKADFVRDELEADEKYDTDIREAFITLGFESLDFKIGRQITTWGTGDLLFINDVFPKNWVSLIAGRPLQYLKIATTSLKTSIYSGIADAELIITPFYEEDILPDGERLHYYAPDMPEGVEVTKRTPENDSTNTELSLKLSKYLFDTDFSMYAHRTHWRTPQMKFYDDNTAEMYYPRLAVYGASMQRSLAGGILKLEGGYYDSLEDTDGTDPMLKNSEWRGLIGYEKEIVADFNVGLQYYTEVMSNYEKYVDNLSDGEPKRDEMRQVVSLRITQFLKYQTLRVSLYTQYSPSDEDYYVNPEIKYNLADNLYAAIGANVFGGKDNYTMYGQFDKNDNLYTQLRYTY